MKELLKKQLKLNKHKSDINQKLKDLSTELTVRARHEANYHPIDRFFIDEQGYFEKIIEYNALDFMLYNLEKMPNLYSEQLLLCIPELWDEINYDEIIKLLKSFTTSFSFYAFLRFTYKYLEIDILDLVFLNDDIEIKFKKDISDFFKRITATFYKDEDDYFEFEENLIGVDLQDWMYIKQRLLVDERIKPVELSQEEFYERICLFDSYYNGDALEDNGASTVIL